MTEVAVRARLSDNGRSGRVGRPGVQAPSLIKYEDHRLNCEVRPCSNVSSCAFVAHVV